MGKDWQIIVCRGAWCYFRNTWLFRAGFQYPRRAPAARKLSFLGVMMVLIMMTPMMMIKMMRMVMMTMQMMTDTEYDNVSED